MNKDDDDDDEDDDDDDALAMFMRSRLYRAHEIIFSVCAFTGSMLVYTI